MAHASASVSWVEGLEGWEDETSFVAEFGKGDTHWGKVTCVTYASYASFVPGGPSAAIRTG
eukprot:1118789-Amphidinium_carterae.1